MDNISSLAKESHAKLNPNMKVHTSPVPKKMAEAIAIVEKYGLPPQLEKPKKSKKTTSSSLQNELLMAYNFEPTEEEMRQLKAFLAQLFAYKLNTSKANQAIEMEV